ncbi:MAG: hypothetical protein NZ473_03885 [Candidatus Kapabacteria bacterium]|nr:hypothetical protein [Candidatus Kapabacteria bacterium]MDW8225101.1 hypothetical protein [Bacteroidota bacterium]
MRRLLHSAILLVVLWWGCSTPSRFDRPRGNLEPVNSPAADFAPSFRPIAPNELFFTSSRRGSEDLWSAAMLLSIPSLQFQPPLLDSSGFGRWLTSLPANEGTAAFISPTEGIAAAQRTITPEASISGGMDLLGFIFVGGTWRAFPLGDTINSPAWDAQPTVGTRGDTVLLIFASDRMVPSPSMERGWSRPFANAFSVLPNGDTLWGNADLYYALRVGGRWTPARNLAEVPGGSSVNTPAQEYFPFLFCPEYRPRLLFASDRTGDFDLYVAELDVDFLRQRLAVRTVRAFPKDEDTINSRTAELSPAIPYPHATPDSLRWLFFASDRDTSPRPSPRSPQRSIRNVGGIDLYAFPVVLECRPPRVIYSVVVLDAEVPSRPVLQPVLELRDGSGRVIERRTAQQATLELIPGKPYSAAGGSLYDSLACERPERMLTFYTDADGTPTRQRLALSQRSRTGSFMIAGITADTIISDTVWVFPAWYTPPQCSWIFSEMLRDPLRRSVPYYQTAFWEVNTPANLRRHLLLFRTRAYEDAGFIELHPDNQYFGYQYVQPAALRMRRERRYEGRVSEYAFFARIVERNLRLLADSITRIIIPRFLDYNARRNGQAKLIITLAAYSDLRPIIRGDYRGSEVVSYVGGSYDSASGQIRLYPIVVPPGASLVGRDNDTLSKLRAFFGFRELLQRLQGDSLFTALRRNGQILLPTDTESVEEFQRRIRQTPIIFLAEGRQYDPTVIPRRPAYTAERIDDYYELDVVRRIDLFADVVEYQGPLLRRPPCCAP